MKEINLVSVNFWREADKRKIDFNVLDVTRNDQDIIDHFDETNEDRSTNK